MQAPVQEQQLHGLTSGFLGTGLALGRLQHVGQRLGDAEEEQRDADTGGEQHPGPGQVAEFGLVVIGPQLDLAVAGQGRDHDEHQVQGHGQHVVPANGVGSPALRRHQPLPGRLRKGNDDNAEDQDETGGKVEHRRVHAYVAAWS
jgi:hypothetical protein